jgi:hypothetical protein
MKGLTGTVILTGGTGMELHGILVVLGIFLVNFTLQLTFQAQVEGFIFNQESYKLLNLLRHRSLTKCPNGKQFER